MKKILNHMPEKIRPATKTHGGKWYLARPHAALAPTNIAIFGEVCVGGGSFFANLHVRLYQEVVLNDLDAGTMALWNCLRNDFQALHVALSGIPYTESVFLGYRDMAAPSKLLDRAVRHFVVNRMSRGGMGKAFAWSERKRGGTPGDLNAWNTALAQLHMLHTKLQHGPVTILNEDCIGLIKKLGDEPRNFLYVDPPYYHPARKSLKVYAHEMSVEQHQALLTECLAAKCRIMRRGYLNELYDLVLTQLGWRCVQVDMANHSGQNDIKQRRVECVWLNDNENAVLHA